MRGVGATGPAALAALAILATTPLAPRPATAQEADAVRPGGRQQAPADSLPAPGSGDLELPDSVRGEGPTGRELDDLTARVASRLRCPVCRSQSVLESSATLAEQMQREIRRRLAAGQSPEEVEAYFVSRYGEWILLQPEPQGLNLLVYLLPAAALLAGGLLIWNRLRAWTGAGRAEGAAGGARAGPGETTYGPEPTEPDAGAADGDRGPDRSGPSREGAGAGLSPEEEERIDELIRERERGAAS